MARLFSFNMVTLNGFFEGPTPWSIDWHQTDEEFAAFAVEQLQTIGTLLFGRRTYAGMAEYWPGQEASESDPETAAAMNGIPKVVFSPTLERADWNNTRLVRDGLAEEINRLKQESSKDLGLFGSANLMASLMRLNLVDEHRVMVNPVLLPAGRPLFQDLDAVQTLKLRASRTFKNGNVLLTYESSPSVS